MITRCDVCGLIFDTDYETECPRCEEADDENINSLRGKPSSYEGV